MEKIYDLIKQIRESNYENEELFDELRINLFDIAKKAINIGRRERFILDDNDKFTSEDAFLTGNRYEQIFLDELIDDIVEVDAYTTPTETYLAIFEYMVENNISSYKQDW